MRLEFLKERRGTGVRVEGRDDRRGRVMIETSKRTVATELTNAAIFCLSELILADRSANASEK